MDAADRAREEPGARDMRGILDPDEMLRHVDFARYPVSAELDGVVEFLWSVRWSLPEGAEHHQQVLNPPAGHVSVGTIEDAAPLDSPVGRLYGLVTEMTHRHLVADGWTVAGRTAAAGTGVLFGCEASNLTGRRLDLAWLLDGSCGVHADDLVAEINGTDGELARARVLEHALVQVLGTRRSEDIAEAREVSALARVAETDRTVRRPEQLAALAGASVRTLERRFARHVGISPAWVIRRWRIIEVAELARAGDADWPGWAAVAQELGYSDQAHLARDVRQHIGLTPSGYRGIVTPSG